jgi:hypothetical protein
MIHFVDNEFSELYPMRGLIIVGDGEVSTLHIVLGFKWPKRRWFACDYDRAFEFAKPMPWMRLSLLKYSGAPNWLRKLGLFRRASWLWSRFEFAHGVTHVDETRRIKMTREQINVTHIYREPA